MMNPDLSLNPFGRLVLVTPDGTSHEGVTPVRAFPVAAPEEGIALVSPDGRELAWIDRLADLPAATRLLVENALAGREFMPEIRRIEAVSGYVCPCQWAVETDRGMTRLTLKGEEDIRRLAPPTLLITDSHGIHFLIRDPEALDRISRKILDRFL